MNLITTFYVLELIFLLNKFQPAWTFILRQRLRNHSESEGVSLYLHTSAKTGMEGCASESCQSFFIATFVQFENLLRTLQMRDLCSSVFLTKTNFFLSITFAN
ncbi:hypothetical protein XENOCAPTIV_002446 [Xenoophorus captivus]|uniref:Secreted protein n=1 Tax=Xenoophorus captivus TaxID=1517983 RepID=A0ABV0QG14_9TELE